MAEITPTAGQQSPSKYPRVGPNYLKYGEQPGYDYYYWDDRYHPNKEAQLKSVGQEVPKEPGLTDQLVPIAALTGGATLATEAGKSIIPAAKGLLGGGAASTTGTTAAGTGGAAYSGTAIPEVASVAGADSPLVAAGAGGAEAAGSIGLGPLAAIAAGTYLGGKSAYDMATGKGKAWGKANTQDKIGRGLLGVATGGLSEVGNRLLNSHESTKDAQDRRWSGLSDSAQLLKTAAHPENDTGTWSDGEKWNMESALKRASANPDEFRGVYGNVSTFGDDWFKYDADQQRKIVKGLIDAGLYKSNKGDIIITDPEEARRIKDRMLSGTPEKMQKVSGTTAKGLLGG